MATNGSWVPTTSDPPSISRFKLTLPPSIFIEETTHKSYTSTLVPKIYLGGKYHLNEKQNLGLLIYAEFFDGIQPAFTAFYGHTITKHTHLGTTYSIKNKLFNHFGLSIVERIGKAVYIVQGRPSNIKITTPDDLALAETYYKILN